MFSVIFSFVSRIWLLASLLVFAVIAFARSAAINPFEFEPEDTITRDVAVIGGGSGGTYAAISLIDKGKSVIVIEKKNRIGGHAETYIDPGTGIPIDEGVLIFENITVVTNYFKRFNLPLTISDGFFAQASLNFDFRTGKIVNQTFTPSEEEVSAAIAAYLGQRNKWPQLNNGTFLPSPVPEELYMPFGNFVEKYGIQAAVPTMFDYNPGVGNILANPTIEQMRYWGPDILQCLSTGFLTTAHHNTSELYSRAQAELTSSSSLLLNSIVVNANRGVNGAGIKLVVGTPQGKKLVLAKKLIIAVPPKLDILAPFDLGNREKSVFGKWVDAGYYVGILNNTGFPANTSIINAAQHTSFNLPHLPGAYSFAQSVVPPLQMVTFATLQSSESFPVSDTTVQEDILDTIKKLQKQNPNIFSPAQPYFVDFHSHAPYTLQVKTEDIKDGFYKKLYALQGLRNTYYTGAAFRAEDSSQIWKYTENMVLPQILREL